MAMRPTPRAKPPMHVSESVSKVAAHVSMVSSGSSYICVVVILPPVIGFCSKIVMSGTIAFEFWRAFSASVKAADAPVMPEPIIAIRCATRGGPSTRATSEDAIVSGPPALDGPCRSRGAFGKAAVT